jgi:hypothetical protein
MSAILVTEDQAFANWPTLDEAIGCANCSAMFRMADNGRCPHCRSEALLPISDLLAKRGSAPAITSELMEHLRYFGRAR